MNFKKRFLERPLSWSQLSSFEWDKNQWHVRYILNAPTLTTPEMEFGKLVGEKLANDETFLPSVPRLKKFEVKLEARFGKIPLIGFLDTADSVQNRFDEYKTGKKGKNEWSQKKVDNHGQIDMYLLMLYLTHKVRPEDMNVALHWLPTVKNEEGIIALIEPFYFKTFETKRTLNQILQFGVRINRAVAEMEKFCESMKW